MQSRLATWMHLTAPEPRCGRSWCRCRHPRLRHRQRPPGRTRRVRAPLAARPAAPAAAASSEAHERDAAAAAAHPAAARRWPCSETAWQGCSRRRSAPRPLHAAAAAAALRSS
eukprot:27448-Chlamydomonas_euryale.AAC.1